MIRMLRGFGAIAAGARAEMDPRAERALVSMGAAEAVERSFDIDSMTKAQLVGLARELGVEVDPKAAKAEIAQVVCDAS